MVACRSVGLHTNGFSLARKIFFDAAGYTVDTYLEDIGASVGEALLIPHRCYAPSVLPVVEKYDVRAMAHITGGGLTDNIPRVLPEGCDAVVSMNSFTPLPIFQLMQQLGNVPDDDMRRTFNLGVGYVCIVPADEADAVKALLIEGGEDAWILGEIAAGSGVVRYA